MIAQKLTNNKICISNSASRKDAVKTIDNLTTSEFYALAHCARNWEKSLNDTRDILFTSYENENSKVCKEFEKIYAQREAQKVVEENKQPTRIIQRKQILDSSKEQQTKTEKHKKISTVVDKTTKTKKTKTPKDIRKITSYVSNCIGTSKLVRIPTRQIIKIARRKSEKDNKNRENSVCIDNILRESFFNDCKMSHYFSEKGLYELMYIKEDKNVYEKWDRIIDNIYREGISNV